MTSLTSRLAAGFLLLPLLLRETESQCRFPLFLRRPKLTSGPGPRYWITEVKYQSTSSTVESQLEVYVAESELVAKIKFKVDCLDPGSGTPCYHTEVAYRRKCLIDRSNGKFQVQHIDGGGGGGQLSGFSSSSSYVTCMKFIQRNLNVVQIFLGPREDKQAGDVCSEDMLQRQEWPWIVPMQEEWNFCPLNGGFDFHATLVKNTELCPDEWRPSRLESECVQGESLWFVFSSQECSPFQDKRLEARLLCWANWEEEGFQFIVASMPSELPQFVLRIPISQPQNAVEAMRLSWYFSPICPTTKRGLPSGPNAVPVTVLELALNRSEPGLCYDDSYHCSEYAKEGRCVNSALYQYANYCKRSCGLCNLLPSSRSECRFPADLHGDWLFFESDRKERVTIRADSISFSLLGRFICKSKHWNINYYKLFSVFPNGCRPRYTCLHLEKDNEGILRFQMSSSSVVDQSFDLCVFRDDPVPLGNRIHSAQRKILIRKSFTIIIILILLYLVALIAKAKVRSDTCGLHGVIQVFTRLDGERRSCWGNLTDWSVAMCGSGARLRLSLIGQCPYSENATIFALTQQEYICSAYIQVDDSHALLITKMSSHTETYLCWAIKTYSDRMPYPRWQEIYLLSTAQCGTLKDFDETELNSAQIALWTHGGDVVRPCGQLATTRSELSEESEESAAFEHSRIFDPNDSQHPNKPSSSEQDGQKEKQRENAQNQQRHSDRSNGQLHRALYLQPILINVVLFIRKSQVN